MENRYDNDTSMSKSILDENIILRDVTSIASRIIPIRVSGIRLFVCMVIFPVNS